MPLLISRAEFARRAGVSKPAITKAMKGPLLAARQGNRIDCQHPAAAAYLAAKTAPPAPKPAPPAKPTVPPRADKPSAPTPPAKKTRSAPSAPTPKAKPAPAAPSDPTPVNLSLPDEAWLQLPRGTDQELANYKAKLLPLVKRFGGEKAFQDWLKSLKDMELISKTRLDNGERAGHLVSRAHVKTHVFGLIDGMLRLLLTDAPKTIASRAFTMARSGHSLEECEAMAREVNASHVVHVKDRVRKALTDARAKAMRGDIGQQVIDAEGASADDES
jgi:hypothetical protein